MNNTGTSNAASKTEELVLAPGAARGRPATADSDQTGHGEEFLLAGRTGQLWESQGSSNPTYVRLPYVIRSVDELFLLMQTSRSLLRHLPQGQLTLAIPGLPETETLYAQSKLNIYTRACGCETGGATALVALAVTLAYSVIRAHSGVWSDLIGIWLAALVLIPLCAAAGKLIGLFVARLRLRRTCARLIGSLPPAEQGWMP